ncbi:alpha/beta fold hydrolase [Rubrivivax sp. RP6-9]|uniref:alpha/beta fold hydrolase n=1 Tax=Rubrivivax sp. RP6-9 TaxID=3415750 RepID=UPI003CC57579
MRLHHLMPLLVTLSFVLPPDAAARGSATIEAPTRSIVVDGTRLAYRSIGPAGGVPLLLLNRFRGTMDDWDPALIDRIAAERQVLMFDQPGFARSEGTPQDSLGAFAATAARFVKALGHERVDVMGFSMGGTVALQFALDHPALLRRLVVAGSGPGFVPDTPPGPFAPERIWSVATKPVNDDGDFLFLFFEDSASSQAAGRAYRQRLRARTDAHARPVDAAAWQAQLKSAMAVAAEGSSLLPRLGAIQQPVLVANGRRDVMVSTYASYAMAQALPQGRLLVYPDSGHGFLFQYPDDFGGEVVRFLR